MRLLLEQVRTEDELGLRLRTGHVSTFAVEAEPAATLRAADGRPPLTEERGVPGEHLLVADVESIHLGTADDVVAVLTGAGLTAFLRRPLAAPDVGLLRPGARVSARCVLQADAYDDLVQAHGLPDLPGLTPSWLVERIDRLDATGHVEAMSTSAVGRDAFVTYLVTCSATHDG